MSEFNQNKSSNKESQEVVLRAHDYYPEQVCLFCGISHGKRSVTSKVEWLTGVCDVCGVIAETTSPGNFGHLRDSWKKNSHMKEPVVKKVAEVEVKHGDYQEAG